MIEDELEYLQKKGIVSARHLARAASDDLEFAARVIQPFVDGVDIDGTLHKVSRCADGSRTCFLVAYDLSLEKKAQGFAQAATQSIAPQSGAPQLAGTAAAAPLQSTASVLAIADWDDLKSTWEKQWVPSRKFDDHQLLGAERILARTLYQIRHTRAFAPPAG